MTVVILEDAATDIETGRGFYESREQGVGDYFVQCLLSDLESLVLYAGTHGRHFEFPGCCRSVFRLEFTTKLRTARPWSMPFSTCGEIRSGSGQN